MSFSSATDARDKITDPRTDVQSLGRLFMSNRMFDTSTVFYTDETKTILAPAGNTVCVVNSIAHYITLDGSGMMTSPPVKTLNAGFDTNWVDDKLYKGDTKVSNQWTVGGTDLSLSGYLLTDNVWTSRPYTNPKRWAINNGPINATALTNINLSDMKGYDMIVYSGEWDGSKFVSYNFTYGFVHLAADTTESPIVGNLIYYKSPDYWLPNTTFDAVSYFRRMPTMDRIKNKAGHEKLFTDLGVPYLDSVYPTTHDDRTSTILEKGLVNRRQIYYQKVYNGATLRTNKNPEIKFNFNPDEIFRQGIATAYGVSIGDVGFADPMWINRICAHLESLIVDNDTWTNGYSQYLDLSPSPAHEYIKYSECNPYHWTTAWASGTGNYNQSMGGALEAFYYAWTESITAEQNAASVQWDFEYLPSAEYNINCGIAFKQMVDTCVSVIWDNPSIGGAAGAAKPKYSIYGGGIYVRAANGPGTSAWNAITSGNYLSSDLYSDYHNYYVNNTIPYTSMTGYRAWYKATIDVFEAFYITNYQNKINEPWYFYNLVHSYDISRKIITQIGVENGKDYSDKMVCGYFWRNFEPVPDGTDVGFARQAFDYQDILRGDRPEVSPSMGQSLAVWSFAYADGLFLWDDGLIGEERQRLIDESVSNNTNILTAEDTFLKYCGDTLMVGKGAHDWIYKGYLTVAQCQDIIEANTDWLVPDVYSGSWTSGNQNYPVSLYANELPLCRYKLNAGGTEALLLIVSPFNNGYTKETHTVRLPAKSNYEVTIDTWGTYTTVVKIIF
jgi:hypothetical protein